MDVPQDDYSDLIAVRRVRLLGQVVLGATIGATAFGFLLSLLSSVA